MHLNDEYLLESRSLIAEGRVPFHASTFEICFGQDCNRTVFSPSTSVLLVGIIQSVLHTHVPTILLSEALDDLSYWYPIDVCNALI